jgi:hypothetical protein
MPSRPSEKHAFFMLSSHRADADGAGWTAVRAAVLKRRQWGMAAMVTVVGAIPQAPALAFGNGFPGTWLTTAPPRCSRGRSVGATSR